MQSKSLIVCVFVLLHCLPGHSRASIVLSDQPWSDLGTAGRFIPSVRTLKTELEVKDRSGAMLGHLRLWIDRRLLTEEGIRSVEMYETDAYRSARLEYIGPAGELVASEDLEKPVAGLNPTILEDGRRVFEVMEDYSIGMGSYNGPVSSFIRVLPGRWEWLELTNAKDKTSSRIRCMSSLKSYWRIRDAKTILKAHCRPNFSSGSNGSSDQGFLLTYWRYYWDGRVWVEKSVSRSGYSDFEADVPDSEFP